MHPISIAKQTLLDNRRPSFGINKGVGKEELLKLNNKTTLISEGHLEEEFD